jgi:Tol biopolymer transport system component
MRKAILLLLALAALPGAGVAGSYQPPPGDATPAWSPDGEEIAFATTRAGHALAVVSADGSSERRLLERPFNSWSISPDWSRVAWADVGTLHVSRLDGSDEHAVGAPGYVGGISWAPDAARLAFSANSAVYSVNSDGGGLRRLVAGSDPAWSPDGGTIAFEGGSAQDWNIHTVSPSGSGERTIVAAPGAQLLPTWSPDGTRIAFLTQSASELFATGVVRADGSGLRTYPGPGVSNAGGFAWTADGRALVVATNSGLVRVGLPEGTTKRLARFGDSPTPSPDGAWLAFAGSGECQDRFGIYVVRTDGTRQRRVTNDCRIVGTPGDDVLHGTDLADVLDGLAGNDRLVARDPGYVGDTLLGGPGNDVLVGDYRIDIVSGGSGDDVLRGGPSGDQLVGGPGRDRIDGQGGRDLVYARDGQRDIVICGTNAPGTPERDEVVVDRFDRVAGDCEVVNGQPKGSLTITLWPEGRDAGRPEVRTLRCGPAGGTVSRPGLACRRLASLERPFAPVPRDTFCTQIFGGPQEALVTGTYLGRKVWARFNRRDGCQVERWNRHAFLFAA